MALVYSAMATQDTRMEDYGKDVPLEGSERWNGGVILTVVEMERPLAKGRGAWFGEENLRLTDFSLQDENAEDLTYIA